MGGSSCGRRQGTVLAQDWLAESPTDMLRLLVDCTLTRPRKRPLGPENAEEQDSDRRLQMVRSRCRFFNRSEDGHDDADENMKTRADSRARTAEWCSAG